MTRSVRGMMTGLTTYSILHLNYTTHEKLCGVKKLSINSPGTFSQSYKLEQKIVVFPSLPWFPILNRGIVRIRFEIRPADKNRKV